MKNYLLFPFIPLLFLLFSCNKSTPELSSQKITYRLTVKDFGESICCSFDGLQHSLNEPCVYDTSFYRAVNKQCSFTVYAECNDDQKLSFVMQILRNDVEVKSKTYIRQNLCGSVNLTMEYYILP